MELTDGTKKRIGSVAREEVYTLVKVRFDIEQRVMDVQILEDQLKKAKEDLTKAKEAEYVEFLAFVDLLVLSDINVDAFSPDAVFAGELKYHEKGESKLVFDRICADVRKALETMGE